jgi:hypothetical protein
VGSQRYPKLSRQLECERRNPEKDRTTEGRAQSMHQTLTKSFKSWLCWSKMRFRNPRDSQKAEKTEQKLLARIQVLPNWRGLINSLGLTKLFNCPLNL